MYLSFGLTARKYKNDALIPEECMEKVVGRCAGKFTARLLEE